VPPLLPFPPGLFIYSSMKDSPPPLRHSRCPTCLATCLFFFLVIAYYSGFFSPGWGSVCPGGYADLAQCCLWSTTCHLAHLVVCVFPSRLGTGIWWQHGSPPGFSI
jgi:hypothetical protein